MTGDHDGVPTPDKNHVNVFSQRTHINARRRDTDEPKHILIGSRGNVAENDTKIRNNSDSHLNVRNKPKTRTKQETIIKINEEAFCENVRRLKTLHIENAEHISYSHQQPLKDSIKQYYYFSN